MRTKQENTNFVLRRLVQFRFPNKTNILPAQNTVVFRKDITVNVLDNAKTVSDAIRKSGGTDEDVRLWNKTWADLLEFCDFESGVTDDYTRDLILCWVGWVINASSDTSNIIYNAVKGFNLTIREDDAGYAGSEKLYEAIEKHTSDPVSLFRELAKDQLERMRLQSMPTTLAKVCASAETAMAKAVDLTTISEDGAKDLADVDGNIEDILDTDDDGE